MNYLIDTDNLTHIPVTSHLYVQIEAAIDEGLVTDADGLPCETADCIDVQGDICVDETMYTALLEMFFNRDETDYGNADKC